MLWLLWTLTGAGVLTALVSRAMPQRELAASAHGTADGEQRSWCQSRPRAQVLHRLFRGLCTFLWYLVVVLPLRPPWARSRPSSGREWQRTVARLVLGVVALSSIAMPGGVVDFTATARVLNAVRLAPVTAPTVLWGLAHGGDLGWRHGMAVVTGMNAGFGPRQGITVGSVYLTGSKPATLTQRMIAHERRHITQWSAFGMLFPPLYWAAGRVGRLTGLGQGAASNVFEITAGLRAGGYVDNREGRAELAGNGWQSDLVRFLDPRTEPQGPTHPWRQPERSPPTQYAADPKEIRLSPLHTSSGSAQDRDSSREHGRRLPEQAPPHRLRDPSPLRLRSGGGALVAGSTAQSPALDGRRQRFSDTRVGVDSVGALRTGRRGLSVACATSSPPPAP